MPGERVPMMAKPRDVKSNVANGLGRGKSRKPKRGRRNRMDRGRRCTGKRPTHFQRACNRSRRQIAPLRSAVQIECTSMDQPGQMPTGVAAARVTTEMSTEMSTKMSPAQVSAPPWPDPPPFAVAGGDRTPSKTRTAPACHERKPTRLAMAVPSRGTPDSSVLSFSGSASRV